MFHNGMSNNEQDYEMCFRVENVVLPKNGYFGVTAATGGLAGNNGFYFVHFDNFHINVCINFRLCFRYFTDDHDALKFLTYNLQSPDSTVTEDARITEDERDKLSKEFQDYQDKLQKQKDE